MRVMKRVFVTLLFIGLSVSVFYVVKGKYANLMDNASEKTFQELQDELKKEKHKKKVISRFEVVEGLRGLNVEDISLTLLDYSYHYLNDSGRRQPFVTVKCLIDIRKFEKDADKLREHLKSIGRQAPVNIQLPDSERLILGLIDDEKDEFITIAALPKSVKPVVKFAELRKNKPEYMILTLEPDESCTKCDTYYALNTAIMGFDERDKTYYSVMEIKTYQVVDGFDDLDAGIGYIDKATVSWSDWIDNEYRELIVETEREILGTEEDAKATFQNKKEIYSWVNDKELALVERIVDEKITMSRKGSPLSVGPEVTLKNGELYEMSGNEAKNKITDTDGKIDSYLMSPDKHYVAYSIIVGYTNDAGDYEGSDEIPQVPVYHIIVMDLELKKQLTVIKPPSENEPFIYTDRWVSNDELMLYDADGIAVGRRYFYNASSNELRRGEF